MAALNNLKGSENSSLAFVGVTFYDPCADEHEGQDDQSSLGSKGTPSNEVRTCNSMVDKTERFGPTDRKSEYSTFKKVPTNMKPN